MQKKWLVLGLMVFILYDGRWLRRRSCGTGGDRCI